MKNITVGITGPSGFLAGHTARLLASNEHIEVVLCPREYFGDATRLQAFVERCDSIIHLAGMNRGSNDDIYAINTQLVDQLLGATEGKNAATQIIFSSSTQRDSVYGKSKQYCERRLAEWAEAKPDRSATTFVIPNIFGPGCRPHYNSVVATFCHMLAGGKTPEVLQDNAIEFIWVTDVAQAIAKELNEPVYGHRQRRLTGYAPVRVSELLGKLQGFHRRHYHDRVVPDLSHRFDAQLYATFESYLPIEDHRHHPEVHADDRGRLVEVLRMVNGGQVFFSTTKPGVVRGNHYHTRKIEWFCVLQGEAIIRLRPVTGGAVQEFRVTGDEPQFLSIPVLHTHHIENVGHDELLTMFWCNEVFDVSDTDTFFEPVFVQSNSVAA